MNCKLKLICAVCVFLICSVYGFTDETDTPTVLDDNEIYVEEPVFGSNIYIHESGNKSGPNVMLVHGIGDEASKIWIDLAAALEKEYHVIYFDLPGFGRSEKKNALYSPENYAFFLKWVHDKYAAGRMNLIGHSLGGAIALYYAATYPSTIERLILVDAAGILHKSALANTLAKSSLGKYSKYPIIKNQIALFSDIIQATIEVSDKTLPKDISAILDSFYLRKVFWNDPNKISAAALINTDFSRQMYNIKSPVWIIWGENDPVAPLRTGKMLSSNIAGSRFIIIRGAGHSPISENPEGFNKLIIKCLSEEPVKNVEKPISPDSNTKNIKLLQKDGIVLEGKYNKINIIDCKNIKIINSEIKSIYIKNSWLEIENSTVLSENTGISVTDSYITVTGGSIEGITGILCANSKIDLAGVKIEGKKSAVKSDSDLSSAIIFSVCKIKSPDNYGYLHDMIEIDMNSNPL